MNTKQKMLSILLSTGLFLTGCAGGQVADNPNDTYPSGTEIMASTGNDATWADATISKARGNGEYDVTFADGTTAEKLTLDKLAPRFTGEYYNVQPQDMVIVQKEDGTWTEATASGYNGTTIYLNFPDGTTGDVLASELVRPLSTKVAE